MSDLSDESDWSDNNKAMNRDTFLHQLINEGEHQQQDFKYKVTDAAKLAKSVSAFANTAGGRLLIGVRDDGHVSGVRSEEEIYMMRSAAGDYCRPAADIDFETYLVDGRTVVIATVAESVRKPVKALCEDGSRKAYIRVADENIVASPVHLRIWRDELSAQGQLISIGDEESRVIQVLENGLPLTVGQVARRSGVSRHRVVPILAKLVRFGLADCRLDRHWLFTSPSPSCR